jgi:hypothetical protein
VEEVGRKRKMARMSTNKIKKRGPDVMDGIVPRKTKGNESHNIGPDEKEDAEYDGSTQDLLEAA